MGWLKAAVRDHANISDELTLFEWVLRESYLGPVHMEVSWPG